MPATFLLFAFPDATAARQACEQVKQWVSAFRLAHSQLAARHDPHDNVVYVRLSFEDYEANAYQRWRERIPREPLFASAAVNTVREGAEDFPVVRKRFDRLREAD